MYDCVLCIIAATTATTTAGPLSPEEAAEEANDLRHRRLQSLVLAIDRAKMFLRNQPAELQALPPLRIMEEDEVTEFLWSGEESVAARVLREVERLCSKVEASGRGRGARHSAEEGSVYGLLQSLERIYHDGDAETGQDARLLLQSMALAVRRFGSSHAALHDLLLLYATTAIFTTPAPYESVVPAVNHAAVGKKGGEERYRGQYMYAQLVNWHKACDPMVTLSNDRRGCLSLPDIECAYLPVR